MVSCEEFCDDPECADCNYWRWRMQDQAVKFAALPRLIQDVIDEAEGYLT